MKNLKTTYFMKLMVWILLNIAAFPSFAQEQQNKGSLNIGDLAPTLVVDRWVKGEPVKEFEKGHVYVMDFWATWCVPCRESMPHMSKLAREFRGKATFIAMNVSEVSRPDREISTMVEAFVKSMGSKMDVTVAMDGKDAKISQTWLKAAGIGSIPSIFIVDQDSRIAWIGQPDGVENALSSIVAKTFDLEAFAKQRTDKMAKPATSNNEALIKVLSPIQQAMIDKDYPSVVSSYENFMERFPANANILAGMYYSALAHTNPSKSYDRLSSLKDSEEVYQIVRVMANEANLEKRFYTYIADFFKKRAKNDFFAMGNVAKAYYHSGNINKAIKIQQKFVEDLKLPTTPSTTSYIQREENVLQNYKLAASGKRPSVKTSGY